MCESTDRPIADCVHLADWRHAAEGCGVDDKIEASEDHKFGWVLDPERNRIEMWEPPWDSKAVAKERGAVGSR